MKTKSPSSPALSLLLLFAFIIVVLLGALYLSPACREFISTKLPLILGIVAILLSIFYFSVNRMIDDYKQMAYQEFLRKKEIDFPPIPIGDLENVLQLLELKLHQQPVDGEIGVLLTRLKAEMKSFKGKAEGFSLLRKAQEKLKDEMLRKEIATDSVNSFFTEEYLSRYNDLNLPQEYGRYREEMIGDMQACLGWLYASLDGVARNEDILINRFKFFKHERFEIYKVALTRSKQFIEREVGDYEVTSKINYYIDILIEKLEYRSL